MSQAHLPAFCVCRIAPSFNGRTAASGAAYRGSNPWGATSVHGGFSGKPRPPAPWSRTIELKNPKCFAWCRLGTRKPFFLLFRCTEVVPKSLLAAKPDYNPGPPSGEYNKQLSMAIKVELDPEDES